MIPKRSLFQLAQALEGVAILGVLPGSPAHRAGIRYGDVLLEVNGERVRSFEEYINAKGKRPEGMDVVVFRSGAERLERLVYDARTGEVDMMAIVEQLAAARLGVLDLDGGSKDEEPPS